MRGFQRILVHIALVALLLRGFMPAGWMPAAQGDAPLVMCSVSQSVDHGAGSDSVPGKDDPRAHENCAFAATPALAAPDNFVALMPMLQEGERENYRPAPVRFRQSGHAPGAPRAPPASV